MNNKFAYCLGIVFILGGGFICYVGLRGPVDRFITVAGIIVAVLGGVAIPHSPLGPSLQTIIVSVGPYLPFGRRADDKPPAPPGV